MNIIGYVRFSHPARSDVILHRSGKTDVDILQELWSEDRMRLRFEFFERFFLPSISHQSDPDFTICVLVSPRMPKQYMDRLLGLVDPVPQIDVHIEDAAPKERIHDLCSRWYITKHPKLHNRSLHFRVDDDDALSVNLIAKMRAYAKRMRVGECLSFPNIMVVGEYKGNVEIVECHSPYTAQALGFVRDVFDYNVSPYAGPGHNKSGMHWNAIMPATPAASLYVCHSAADTAQGLEHKMKKIIARSSNHRKASHLEFQEDVLSKNFPHLGRDGIIRSYEAISAAQEV